MYPQPLRFFEFVFIAELTTFGPLTVTSTICWFLVNFTGHGRTLTPPDPPQASASGRVLESSSCGAAGADKAGEFTVPPQPASIAAAAKTPQTVWPKRKSII